MLQNITRIEHGKIETIEKMKFQKRKLRKRNSKIWKQTISFQLKLYLQHAPKHNENRTWKNGLSRLKLIPEWKKNPVEPAAELDFQRYLSLRPSFSDNSTFVVARGTVPLHRIRSTGLRLV